MIKRGLAAILVITASLTFCFAGTMTASSGQKKTVPATVKKATSKTTNGGKLIPKKTSDKKPAVKTPVPKPTVKPKPIVQKPKSNKEKIAEAINDYLYKDSFSGYVLASQNGSVIFEKSVGKADFKKNIGNTRETKFDVASVTKQFTAFSILQLEEKKALDVKDPISKYLPTFPFGDQITIHQLLCHTSGLPAHPEEFDIKKYRPSSSSGLDQENNDKVKLLFKPDESYSYSNTGYILLGYIVEKVSGKTLDMYFKENIFEPLGMKNTGFKNDKSPLSDMAVGYLSNKNDVAPISWTEENVGFVRGSSGLCTTAADLMIWENALNAQKLLGSMQYKKMYTPNRMHYGYGWYVEGTTSKPIYFHYGIGSGYRAYVCRMPAENLTIILLCNYGDYDMEFIAGMLQAL